MPVAGSGTPEHGRTFTRAAEEIRRLLHQFAAGFLKEPDPQIMPALLALNDIEGPQREDAPEDDAASGFVELAAPESAPGALTAGVEPLQDVASPEALETESPIALAAAALWQAPSAAMPAWTR